MWQIASQVYCDQGFF